MKSSFLLLAGIILLLAAGLAHAQLPTAIPSDPDYAQTWEWKGTNHLAADLTEWSLEVAVGALILDGIIVAYAIKAKPRKDKIKKLLFGSIIGVTLLTTLFLAGGTLYMNAVSPTGGPIHWHTDYEVWNCGTKLDLVDPTGFSNKTGEPTVHEHDDDRMHVEGTILDMHEVTFHAFFEAVGGKIDKSGMRYPTNERVETMPLNGQCNGQPAQLQGFLYRITNPENAKNWTYEQTKIQPPFDEIMAGYSGVPPGDCLIIEYGPVKGKTEHICSSYTYAQNRGELHGR